MNQPSSHHSPSDALPPVGHPASPPHGGRGWVLVVLLLAVVGGGGFFFYRSRQADAAAAAAKGAPGDRAIPCVLAPVEKKDVPVYLEGLGNALPTYTVTVHTQVDGPLSTVAFKEGQFVHKGDFLAQVDPRPFLATLHQAQAALARDQATLKNAELNLERYRSLRAQKLIAEQQYTDQLALKDTTIGTIQTDEAAIESARLNVEYSRIVSPIDGVTGVRLIDPGNIVHAADAGGLVVITQLDPMTVLFTLPEDDLSRVQEELAKGPLSVDAYGRDGSHIPRSAPQTMRGTLTFIDNQINQTTATIRLRASFANPKSQLWPNEFVKSRLLLSTLKGAIVIPAVAVQRGPTGTFVYVVGADMIAVLRSIAVDSLQGDDAIIKEGAPGVDGIAPGELVVIDGQSNLKPKSKVARRAAEGDTKGAGGAAGSGSGAGGTPSDGTVHRGVPPQDSAGMPASTAVPPVPSAAPTTSAKGSAP